MRGRERKERRRGWEGIGKGGEGRREGRRGEERGGEVKGGSAVTAHLYQSVCSV